MLVDFQQQRLLLLWGQIQRWGQHIRLVADWRSPNDGSLFQPGPHTNLTVGIADRNELLRQVSFSTPFLCYHQGLSNRGNGVKWVANITLTPSQRFIDPPPPPQLSTCCPHNIVWGKQKACMYSASTLSLAWSRWGHQNSHRPLRVIY